MQIFWIANRANSKFPQDVFDYLDDEKLVEVLTKYAEEHPRTFLPLLYLLKYSDPKRQNEIAEKLYDTALIACQNKPECDQILQRYKIINSPLANKLAKELGIDLRSIKSKVEKDENLIDKPLLDIAGKDGKKS